MAANNVNPSEEIIEKKDTAPVAMACLILACVALLGAIVFQIMEVAAYRTGDVKVVGQEKAKSAVAKLTSSVNKILEESSGALGEAKTEGDSSSDATGEEKSDATDATKANDAAKAADGAAAKADGAAAKADGAKAGDKDEGGAADDKAADEK